MRFACLFIISFQTLSVYGQMDPDKLLAITEPSRWIKAGQSIRKALVKDSLDPGPAYLMALYYFQPRHPNFHIDTASRYQLLSARLYNKRNKAKQDVPDSLSLFNLRKSIDSAAFQRAKRAGTEEAYQAFLFRFPWASQVPAAVEARNEQAFVKAAKTNNARSYRVYLERFPQSHRAKDAHARMEQLEFAETTKDKHLASYRKFYKEFPSNPNRPFAEKRIFEMMTASGTPSAFLRFLSAYPESRWASRARVLLYSLQRDGDPVPEGKWKTDSLRKERDPSGYWVPVFKAGKYGFINEHGKEVIPPRFANIPEGYRCGEITDRFLVTSAGLLARNGQIVWKGKIKDFDDLGLGFLFVATDSGGFVIHESGYRINTKPVDDAMVIANRYVAYNQEDMWSVISLAGAPLFTRAFEDIDLLDSVVQLTNNKKRILTTPSRMAVVADGGEFKEDFVFDEARKWGEQHYWVRNGVLEGVIDANLKFIIPLDRQNLRKTVFGFVTTKSGYQYVKGIKSLEGKSFKHVVDQGSWLHLKDATGGHWLCERSTGKLTGGDSIWFKGKLSFLQSGDTIKVFLPGGRQIQFERDVPYRFKESPDSSAFMVLQEVKGKSVYDASTAVRLFVAEFDDLEAVAGNLFIVLRHGKKGLVRRDGKIALPVEYDAIVPSGEFSFSLLKDKKFGWFDARTGFLVKPVYDRNVRPYSSRLWLTYKDNGYGFIQPDGKVMGIHSWDEVAHWTDSTAWVRKGATWKMLDVYTQKVRLDNIRQFTYIRDAADKLAIVQQDKAFGVINRKGIVIPIQYTDVINLGTREIPLYFTERFIPDAGLTVVVYFDQHGKSVRSQAMEPDELDKITCEN